MCKLNPILKEWHEKVFIDVAKTADYTRKITSYVLLLPISAVAVRVCERVMQKLEMGQCPRFNGSFYHSSLWLTFFIYVSDSPLGPVVPALKANNHSTAVED